MASVRINWQGDPPPDREAAEAQILRELDELMEDTTIDNLIFHTVFLGKTTDDPSVFVAPNDVDPGAVDCWYSAETVWTSIRDLDDDTMHMVDQARDAMRDGPLPGSQPLLDPDYDT